jgi:hypothetical protein
MAHLASLSSPATGARASNVNYLGAARCRRKFELFYPDGFQDETYQVAERSYKERAHLEWQTELGPGAFRKLLARGEFRRIADIAVRIESRTNLLFSFEKMAIRDAVRSGGAQCFAEGLYDWLHGSDSTRMRFDRWIATVDALPRRKTRVLTWPVVTVWGFIARPRAHIFLKPTVTRIAAEGVRRHLRLSVAPPVAHLRGFGGLRNADSWRSSRSSPARHDRRAVVHLVHRAPVVSLTVGGACCARLYAQPDEDVPPEDEGISPRQRV